MASFRWETAEQGCHLVRPPEPNIWSVMGVNKKNLPEPLPNDDAYATPLGFIIVYVDDILCRGPQAVVESTLEGIKTEWTCSAVEWVKENHWLKFCGMQMLGQPGFARELVERHGSVTGRSFLCRRLISCRSLRR